MTLSKWERSSGPLGVVHVAYVTRQVYGEKMVRGAFRVYKTPPSALHGDKGYLVDRCEAVLGAWTPWEAIGSHPYNSLVEAKRAAKDFFARRYGK